ncbi:stress responsive A/B barrel domain protein [Trichoderma sp. SZMC 28013]
MPVYRVVLFRLKKDASEAQVEQFINESKEEGRKIQGVLSLEIGPALDMQRTKGYDMGIILQLETQEHLALFAQDPHHLRLHDMREQICEDSLAFNLAF